MNLKKHKKSRSITFEFNDFDSNDVQKYNSNKLGSSKNQQATHNKFNLVNHSSSTYYYPKSNTNYTNYLISNTKTANNDVNQNNSNQLPFYNPKKKSRKKGMEPKRSNPNE